MAEWTTEIVSIESISLKKEEESDRIYGIQFELSNGAISPFYERYESGPQVSKSKIFDKLGTQQISRVGFRTIIEGD